MGSPVAREPLAHEPPNACILYACNGLNVLTECFSIDCQSPVRGWYQLQIMCRSGHFGQCNAANRCFEVSHTRPNSSSRLGFGLLHPRDCGALSQGRPDQIAPRISQCLPKLKVQRSHRSKCQHGSIWQGNRVEQTIGFC